MRCAVCGQQYGLYSMEAPKQLPRVETDACNAISFDFNDGLGNVKCACTLDLCPGCMDLVMTVLRLAPKKQEG